MSLALRCSSSDVPVDSDCLIEVFKATARPWPEPLAVAYIRYLGMCALHGRRFWLPADVSPRLAVLNSSDYYCVGRSALAFITGLPPHVARRLLADPSARVAPICGTTEGPF